MSARRTCDGCGSKLPGPRGHGFVTWNGRSVRCVFCDRPRSRRRSLGAREPRVDVDRLLELDAEAA